MSLYIAQLVYKVMVLVLQYFNIFRKLFKNQITFFLFASKIFFTVYFDNLKLSIFKSPLLH